MNIDVTVYLNVRPQSLLSMMLMLLYMSSQSVLEHNQRQLLGHACASTGKTVWRACTGVSWGHLAYVHSGTRERQGPAAVCGDLGSAGGSCGPVRTGRSCAEDWRGASIIAAFAVRRMYENIAVQLMVLAHTACAVQHMLSNSNAIAVRPAVTSSCCLKGGCCAAQVVERIAQRHKYGIVKDFVGHGVGRVFHASPLVHHTRNMERGAMQVGQTFTIEPILTTGGTAWKMWKDDWTVVTKDASLAAQYEHTVLITEAGHDILTTWPERR